MTPDDGRESAEEALGAVAAAGGEPLTTSEVADALDCSRRTAYNRLERLAERDEIESKKVGARGRVWWLHRDAEPRDDARPDDARPNDDGPPFEPRGETDPVRYPEALIDAVDDLLYVIDDSGALKWWNRSTVDVAGYDDHEIESMPATAFFEGDDRERIASAIAEGFETGSVRVEADMVTSAGERIPYEFAATRFDDPTGDTVLAGIGRDVTERRERERELERQRERLAVLNDLNAVVRRINEAIVDQSTREGIERTVCESLAAADTYEFAWIAEVDPRTDAVTIRAEAATRGYTDEVTLSADPDDPAGRGPTGKAVRTQEVQVVRNAFEDESFEPWREKAREYGFRASAAIPIVNEGTLYGVLGLYVDRGDAFDEAECEVVSQLGEVVGHAIAAGERKRALMSDELVEVEFRVEDVFDRLDADVRAAGAIDLDRTVPLGDDDFLVFGTAAADAVETLEAVGAELPHWEDVTLVDSDEGDETRFELRLTDPPVLTAVAAQGGYVERATFAGSDYHLSLRLPHSVDVRRVIDTVRETYPGAEMLSRRQVRASDDARIRAGETVHEDLTERQRSALEAALFSGLFEWPRESAGEDVAASLDVAPATFHQHLRNAQRKVFESVLTDPASRGE
ncbi:GAF domain-containing protein [Halostella sp. JP-L12]|uniref:bacterio-opsin activator domain-containing protein n=1 Tax=Halostella TaxID=1843185 RepID=UPI000EF776D1|nr:MULTISPECIES: bacterio-opsin activator domain-containing protein [Halostella]NHN48575.1 GAF domain-containing protein [Halostella sp. JP-L12]